MSTWEEVKQLIAQKLPDTGINVISPKREREAIYAVINQIIASTPDPVAFNWKAFDEEQNSVNYVIGDPVLDENRWFIAIADNTNKKPILPDGSINTAFWVEENANQSRYIDKWKPQLYTYPVEIVLYNNKIYLLNRTVVGEAPFLSSDIAAEIAEQPTKWINLLGTASGGLDPSSIVNDFSTDPNDAGKVAGANAVYLLFQVLQSNDLDYDTLQEVVNFIKTIDTDGELIAAIDTAVGNDLWRTGNIKELPSFSPVLDLSINTTIRHIVNGPITITLGTDPAPKLSRKAIFYFVADGLNRPDFGAGFIEKYDDYRNIQNKTYRLYFEYVGNNNVMYEIIPVD